MVQAGWTGRVIDGRYAVESVIGAGGMGLVLRARHTFTGATVALKVLKPELELDVQFQQRFLVEARAPNAIGHPAIVNVLDAGKAPDGVLYLVMELLVGRSLRIPAARGELNAGEIRRILLELLDVLGAAHARGFVHRDLKPENLFLVGPTNQVKLLDFGIAKVLDASLARVRTATGATLGTPAYMAPEQFHDPRGVDARADLWAVGVMAYELLAQALPFRGETTHAMLLAIASADPDPIRSYLPQAPPPLEAFFARALSRDIAGRFASATEMAQAIAALPFGTAIVPRPVPQLPQRAGFAQAETPIATPAPFAATPLAATPMSAPVAPLPDRVVAPASVPRGPTRRAWVIGLGVASLVSLAVIIIAVLATRHDSRPVQTASVTPTAGAPLPPPAADAPAASPPENAAAPADAAPAAPAHDGVARTVKRGAQPTAVDAGVPDRTATDASVPARPATDARVADARVDSPPPSARDDEDLAAEQSTIEAACRSGCQVAATTCFNASPTCFQDCIKRPAFRECVKLPLASCDAISVCGMRAICGGGVLRGNDSCSTALACQKFCKKGSISCGCACADTMSPAFAHPLTVVDACAAWCLYDDGCMAKNCGAPYLACH